MRKVVAAVAAAAVLLVGYAAADAADVLPGVLTTAPPWEEPAPFPTVTLEPAPGPAAVLPALDDAAPTPAASGLAAVTAPLLADRRLGGGAGVAVVDVLTGEVLLDDGGGEARIPASTVKLLTTTAALAALGEDTRLRTRTLLEAGDAGAGGSGTATVVLEGGGDVVLASGAGDPGAVVGHAGLGDLAADTAAALADREITSVRLVLDDTLVSGPAVAPDWGPIDLGGGFVMPVAALAVDHGIVPGQARRAADPGLAAARQLASALGAAGVAVEGDVGRAPAGEGAQELAAVESATVGELVAHALQDSDNDVAEILLRLVAVADGRPGDFENGAAATLAQLAALGVDVTGVTMVDGSGLSEGNRVPPLTLARLVALAAEPASPAAVTVAAGMPVAGLQGTLADRFDAQDPAAGVLRAKTGTLLTVVALAGTVLDADGRLLALAVVADELGVGGVGAARSAVDDWTARLAACGCA